MANEQVQNIQRYVNLSDKVEPEVANAVRLLYNVAKDHFDAITALKSQIDSTNTDVQTVKESSSSSKGVTSVGLQAPDEFTVSGSPVTGAGTIVISKNEQLANEFYAGPESGIDAEPIFRKVVLADLDPLRFSQTIGDGIATTFVINHNLGTKRIVVQVQETTGSESIVMVETDITDDNNVTIVFGVPPDVDSHFVVIEA